MSGIIINIISGDPPFTITLDPDTDYSPYTGYSGGIQYLNDVPPGVYTITVVDSLGCTGIISGVTPTTDLLDSFIFRVNVAENDSITLPLVSDGYTFDFTVLWGDGSTGRVSSYNDPDATHIYTGSGQYDIEIIGTCQRFTTNNTEPIRTKIIEVKRWGSLCDFRSLNFWGCTNLTTLPGGPITGASNITSVLNFMRGCTSYTTINPDALLFTETLDVTDFGYAFAESGVTGVLPENLFELNTPATSFDSTFKSTQYTCTIPSLLFVNNINATNFSSTFSLSPFTGDIPVELFETCTGATLFSGTFAYCWTIGTGDGSTGVIPDHLFWNNTEALDFNQTFRQCYGLIYGYTANLFSQNTKVTSFYGTFWECESISQSLPEDMFYNNTDVTTFAYCFGKNFGLTGNIPTNLFRYNTEVTSFQGTLYGAGSGYCHLTGDIPADLFYYNTGVTTFRECFRRQVDLEKIPNGLFRNNKLATNFYGTFQTCSNAVLEQYPFSESNSGSTISRFSGQTINFGLTFDLNYYYQSAGTRYAPEVWDDEVYNMVGQSDSYRCFYETYINGVEAYSNIGSIPIEWRQL